MQAIPSLGILLKRIGLKEPELGQKTTSTVCSAAVRPQNGHSVGTDATPQSS
jgi:hypothetical protein